MSTLVNTTKNELLHEASRMLLAKGFNGFSLQELAEKLHIKKSSLYHHYPSKTALAVELYRFYQSSFSDWTGQHQHLSPEKQIIAYTEKLTSWICEKNRVCPVGALSLEWHLVDSKLQTEIKTLHELQKKWLTKLYKVMQQESGLKISIHDAVLGTMGLIQGSIQLSRLHNDSSIMKKNLKAYLKCIKE